jgi:signal transduction histidine kinase
MTMAITLYRRRVTVLKRATAAREAFARQLIESQESERKRIAGELHDSLGQSLSIIMSRATLALNKPEDHKRALDQVGEIAAAASDAIKEVREIAYNLRPVDLDRLGLSKALLAMAERVSTSTGISITADIDDTDGLFSSQSEINLYRIVQECINNVVKHSRASQARVEVKRLARGVSVTVQDNGKGFTVGAASPPYGRPSGFGLMGISERARILGGKPTIQSAPGRGTAITILISLKEDRNGR